ncbi:hypothetical protein Tco_1372383 [Tanacetum coccineum]
MGFFIGVYVLPVWMKDLVLIISFDLKREKFDEASLPERLARSHGLLVLAKVNESLHLLEYYIEGEIWVCGVWTKKVGVNKPFTKIYSGKVEGKSVLYSVLGFKNNGEVVLAMEDDSDIGQIISFIDNDDGAMLQGVGIKL